MPDTILIDAELLLKQMQEASSLEAHWRTLLRYEDRERILSIFRSLYVFAEECDQSRDAS